MTTPHYECDYFSDGDALSSGVPMGGVNHSPEWFADAAPTINNTEDTVVVILRHTV